MSQQIQSNPSLEYQALMNKYNGARANLLLLVMFTALNLLLLVSQSYTYFLFSALVPYILTDLGLYLSGMYPEEYYVGELASIGVFDTSFFAVMLAISIIILALYLVAWFFSKKGKVGWLIFALVLFSIDTVVMFLYYGISLDMIVDILFHAWVIYYLVSGIAAHSKIKKLEAEGMFPIVEVGEPPVDADESSNGEIEAPENKTETEEITESDSAQQTPEEQSSEDTDVTV